MSVIASVRAFIQDYPGLHTFDDLVGVEHLPEDTKSYAIEASVTSQPIKKRYINGDIAVLILSWQVESTSGQTLQRISMWRSFTKISRTGWNDVRSIMIFRKWIKEKEQLKYRH